ncbi:ras-related protein Rab-20 [Tachysurus ichikawai]
MAEPTKKLKKPDVKIVLLGDMNVGKTSLLHRYTERRFKDTVSTVGGAFFLKQWGPYNISIWDTAGRRSGFIHSHLQTSSLFIFFPHLKVWLILC